MPTSINNSTSMDEVDMIAGFLRDCGYKLGMNYGAGGSSAGNDDAEKALKAFGYDENTIDLRHKWITSGWTNMLRTNIDNGQPVYYCGYSKVIGGKGHTFVVDGYQTGNSPIYHINWGWKGLYNGWYNIDDAYINDTTHYEHLQTAIFGIRPAPRYCTDLTLTTVESPKFCIAQAGTVTLNGVQMSNITDGRVYSSESIILTNGTYISSGCNVVFDIKPVPCTSPIMQAYAPWNTDSANLIKQTPSNDEAIKTLPVSSKILRDGQLFIIRDGKTFTVTGQEVK